MKQHDQSKKSNTIWFNVKLYNNGRAKLTIIQVNEIRNNVNLKNKELAIKYNIHQSYVSSIKNGNVWHL